MSPCRVGIVTALASEARALTDRNLPTRQVVAHGDDAVVWLCGMGQDAARHAAHALADAGATALAVFGVAGALTPALRSGTLFCPECIVDERGRDYPTSPEWRYSLDRHFKAAGLPARMDGSLLSVASPLLDAAVKTSMRDRHQAMAVDMESASVAAVASERGLPLLVLRAIIDERDDDVPGELHAGVDEWGRLLPMSMLTTLVCHPRLVASLPRLSARMRKATHALRMAAGATGGGLGHEPPGPC